MPEVRLERQTEPEKGPRKSRLNAYGPRVRPLTPHSAHTNHGFLKVVIDQRVPNPGGSGLPATQHATDSQKWLGKTKCGPHDDFEWGMINGKPSAIRWILGDESDTLDT